MRRARQLLGAALQLTALPALASHKLQSHTASMPVQELKTQVCIIGSGPAAHTAAIYAARAELKPILFEVTLGF